VEFLLIILAILAILAFVLGYVLGHSTGHSEAWIEAHLTVADDCRKLGKFYVGKAVFTCSEINDNNPEKED